MLVSGYYIYCTYDRSKQTQLKLTERNNECLSWTTYNPELKAWRWKNQSIEEYYATRNEAVENCMAVYIDIHKEI